MVFRKPVLNVIYRHGLIRFKRREGKFPVMVGFRVISFDAKR